MDTMQLLVVAGARPNFMKIAPIIRGLRKRKSVNDAASVQVDYKLVHTGQHYDQAMSQQFFDELQIPAPDFDLAVGSSSHASQTANIMTKFEPVCEQVRPNWVLVVGDVNSTMACTLVASKLGIKVAHLEAGLRSFDRSMPEEINRLVTDALADLLLTPSQDADENLKREGVPAAKIRLVGNIMIDTLIWNLERIHSRTTLDRLGVKPREFVYVTLHRPGNVDSSTVLRTIIERICQISEHLDIVFPMHPRTRKMVTQFDIDVNGNPALKIVEPVGYLESLCLSDNARFVLTDSGGIQEETTFFRTPCLTLRPNTERPVTISLGSNRLTDIDRISVDVQNILRGPLKIGTVPPLWDGHTSDRVISSLLDTSRF